MAEMLYDSIREHVVHHSDAIPSDPRVVACRSALKDITLALTLA